MENMLIEQNEQRINNVSTFNFHIEVLCENNFSFCSGFFCNDDVFSDYLHQLALEDSEYGNGVTYLVIDDDLRILASYYTVSSNSITIQGKIESSINLNMFAVHQDFQNKKCSYNGTIQYISDCVIWEIIGNIYKLSKSVIGVKYISLYATKNAKHFYERNCFVEYPNENASFDLDISIDSQSCIPMIMSLYD